MYSYCLSYFEYLYYFPVIFNVIFLLAWKHSFYSSATKEFIKPKRRSAVTNMADASKIYILKTNQNMRRRRFRIEHTHQSRLQQNCEKVILNKLKSIIKLKFPK